MFNQKNLIEFIGKESKSEAQILRQFSTTDRQEVSTMLRKLEDDGVISSRFMHKQGRRKYKAKKI